MDAQVILNKLDEIQQALATKASSQEIQDVLTKLHEKEAQIEALESNVAKLTADIESRDKLLTALNQRIDRLELETSSNETKRASLEHLSYLHGRKIDDQEQVSRKVNLRINGIAIQENETPASLLREIKEECKKVDVDVGDGDFDHCHRNGKVYKDAEGNTKQTVLLKMRSWAARDRLYQNRKKFKFKIGHDLTFRRQQLFTKANELIKSDPSFQKMVDYALADKNCKLKLKSKIGKYYHFNSESELYSIVHKLDDANLSREFINDEKRNELFY